VRYYGLLLTATVLMATGFVASKLFLNAGIHPLALVVSRFSLAGLLALIWLYFRGQLQLPKTRRDLFGVVVVGTLQTAVLFGTGFMAMSHLSAATISILTLTMPIWVTVFEGLIARRLPGRGQILSLVMGMAGVTLIIGSGVGPEGSPHALWYGLTLLGACSWAAATVFTKRGGLGVTGWSLNGWQMLIGGLQIQLLMFVLDVPVTELPHDRNMLLFLWLVIPASILSFGCWFAALRLGGAEAASGYLFLIPLFTALMSVPILHATFTVTQVLGGAAVAVAVWRMSRVDRRGPSPGDDHTVRDSR